MVVLNFYGKIEPICISNKLKLYIANLPADEPNNNWREHLSDELKRGIKAYNIDGNEIGTEPVKRLHSKVFSLKNEYDSSVEIICDNLSKNMICMYFDYEYKDMPLGGWKTNCFDGRFCEGDYVEKIVDFFKYCDSPSDSSISFPKPTPWWVYSSNYDCVDYVRLYRGGDKAEAYIDSLKKWGNLIDSFLRKKEDYLLLDYLINSICVDNGNNAHHIYNSYSLCQLFLEKTKEIELDNKLIEFIDEDTEERKKICAELYRQLRNKLAHGDFIAFEKVIEEYAKKIMDGRFWYDYSEYSRKNWVIGHVCGSLDSIVRKLIWTSFYDRERIERIKQSDK